MTKKGLLFVLSFVLLFIGILVWMLEPWVPAVLRRDVSRHREEFIIVAEAIRTKPHLTSFDLQADDKMFETLLNLGYYRVDNCHGTVLFFKYRRFRSIGTIGIALSPEGQQPSCMTFDMFYPLVDGFYIWDQE